MGEHLHKNNLNQDTTLLWLGFICLAGCSSETTLSPAQPWIIQEQGLGEYCTPGSDPEACSLAHCIHLDVDLNHNKLIFTNVCEETLYIPLTYSFFGGESCSRGDYRTSCNSTMWMKTSDGNQWGNSALFAPEYPGYETVEEKYSGWLTLPPEKPLFFHMAGKAEDCPEHRDAINQYFSLSCSEDAISLVLPDETVVSYDLLLPLPQLHQDYKEGSDPICSSSCQTITPSCAEEPGFIYIENVHSYAFTNANLDCRISFGRDLYF